MVRILKVEKLNERKKLLLMQCELNRHTLRLQVVTAQHSLGQIKKKFTIAGISTAAISGIASIVAMVASKRRESGGTGIISKIFSGISFFNQIKGLFGKMRQPAGEPGEEAS